MLIHEAKRAANLTKKAVEYYVEQALVFPRTLDNGYRDFNDTDIERLKKISVLRRLGLGTEEIRTVLEDETGDALHRLSVQRELRIRREQAGKSLLDQLGCGKSYEEISKSLEVMEQNAAISDKLLNAFPGYYGRFVCLHFARFLDKPAVTEEQQEAYEEIIEFLDSIPPLTLPADLQEYLSEYTSTIGTENINEMLRKTKENIENPEAFLSENKEMLEWYFAWKQSDEYRASPAYRLQALLKQFHTASGYYDIFIPAMKRLSEAYAAYYEQLEAANDRLLLQYPEMKEWWDDN